ncbi:MAG: aldo/keto reductase [Oscillospiraceae bacterium]|jgi:predicted aldo/keto reductase-like oxidoreductase|nr:aldo/keto reductase [Oscillospiraceae bacterium]
MVYKQFKDKNLSTLGYGGMRLPSVPDSRGHIIDEPEAERLLIHAYNSGVNYFDTAFFYHAGNSERVIGKTLSRFPRDSYYIGDKWPGNFVDPIDDKLYVDVSNMGMKHMTFSTPAEIFEYQLKNVGVDYFDFYMLHNVAESTYDLYTDKKIGVIEYLLGQKEKGRIKHLGFSTHGRYETIDKFLKEYSDSMEFALMQLNYLDWTLQEAGKKYDVITKYNIPIFVMEPVRGGKLAAPGGEAEEVLKNADPAATPASWAFRFLQSLSNVHVVVSGMTTMDQLKENIDIFSRENPTTAMEIETLWKAVDKMASFVPCTSCRYCCDACPQNLDIPMLIATYNEAVNEYGWYVNDILDTLSDDEKPGACISCNACSPLCPQDIDIADIMRKFDDLTNKP